MTTGPQAGEAKRPPRPTEAFLHLARTDPARICSAVAAARSPYQALALLGYGGDRARAEQLVDAVIYFGWPTAHWLDPLPTGLQSVRDFSDLPSIGTGVHGERFELAFEARMKTLLTERYGPGRAEGPTHCYGRSRDALTYFPEPAVASWQAEVNSLIFPSEPGPWDGVLWAPARREASLWEVKATAKSVVRLRRQLRNRAAEVEALRSAGWTVTVAAVVGRQPLRRSLRWVRELTEEGVVVQSLSELALP